MGPDGALILVPMPWPILAHAMETNLKAIWAYLQSLTPIKNAVPDNVPPRGHTYATPGPESMAPCVLQSPDDHILQVRIAKVRPLTRFCLAI
jgi:hypothetical protein